MVILSYIFFVIGCHLVHTFTWLNLLLEPRRHLQRLGFVYSKGRLSRPCRYFHTAAVFWFNAAFNVMKAIAKDTSDFPKLRERGCVYVDKTAYLHRLITTDGQDCVFIARPRRFGKSLMISTLKAILEGRRNLFEGLAISQTDWPWHKHPVHADRRCCDVLLVKKGLRISAYGSHFTRGKQ